MDLHWVRALTFFLFMILKNVSVNKQNFAAPAASGALYVDKIFY